MKDGEHIRNAQRHLGRIPNWEPGISKSELEDIMLYVFRLTVAAGSKISEGFEVFSKLSDAKRIYNAAQSKARPGGPIVSCGLYVTEASDKAAAIEAVKSKNARPLDVQQEARSSRDEPSLVELIDKLSGAKGPA